MFRTVCASVLLLLVATKVIAIPSVIQPSIKDWVNAAQTNRADLLLLGDSIAQSFDAGFSNAAYNRADTQFIT